MSLFLVAARFVNRAGRYRVATLLSIAVLIVFIGATLFSVAEHVDFGTALYWAIVTATTVGYGDVVPHNTTGRVIAVGVMVTTIPTVGAVFALIAGASVLARLRRFFGLDTNLPSRPYTVIYGAHPVVPRVVGELAASGDPVVVVAAEKPPDHLRDVYYVAGDPADEEVVRRSRPENANRALIACVNDADALVIAVSLRTIAPNLEVFALTQQGRVARALKDLGVAVTLSSVELLGHTLAKALETRHAGDVLLQLVESDSLRMREVLIESDVVGRPLSELRRAKGRLVLGVSRDGKVDLGVGSDPVLTAGDLLIFVEIAPGDDGDPDPGAPAN
jgi:voltage-gated potassium channel